MTGSGGLNGVNQTFTNDCTSSWLELESDPGLFTLLVDDFGVKGIQVEEVYDLTKPLDNSIFGFIFLFKWIERRNGRRSKSSNLDSSSNYVSDPNIVNNMFFAHQIVPNSCATHALLSVLLNSKTSKYFQLGELLENFKKLCEGYGPEMKGLAIGNQPHLAQAHNSYAKPDNSLKKSSTPTSSSLASSSASNLPINVSTSNLSTLNSGHNSLTVNISNELFHFICFVPINGRLYELDGLKPYPVDHGPFEVHNQNFNLLDKILQENKENDLRNILNNLDENYRFENSNWTNKFKQIILQRISSFNTGQQNQEIRFNLMAVAPDKMVMFKEDLNILESNRKLILSFLNETESDTGSPGSDEMQNKSRQLRSSRKSESEKSYVIVFDLLSDNLVDNLMKNAQKNSKINFLKFKDDFLKLILNFDLSEMIKIFRIKSFGEQNIKIENFLLKKNVTLNQLKLVENKLVNEIDSVQVKINEEIDKRKKYMIEALRRKHVYNEFIITYLKTLAENGKLEEIVRNSVRSKPVLQTNPNENKQAASSFFISPKTLFLQPLTKKQRKK
ncbi:unnamed protein product [Brachionus calyciflorus]|uniref:ubiquitinyl hydrolase 1 n=1 Tax=Brachionus calyciflorus TaxID=104777 RepID=A0A813UXU0_9BILA|nr:unnamed protein product [Brachionus calyciflorus]